MSDFEFARNECMVTNVFFTLRERGYTTISSLKKIKIKPVMHYFFYKDKVTVRHDHVIKITHGEKLCAVLDKSFLHLRYTAHQ